MPLAINWLEGKLNLDEVEESTPTQQKEEDIDLWVKCNNKTKSVEVKLRRKEYKDILLETISNITKKTPGWLYKSNADYLAYLFCIDGKITKGYVGDMKTISYWYQGEGIYKGYPIKYGNTAIGYKTQNRAVPENHIPFEAWIYHPQYGLLRGI